ncbi:MAG: ATP-grasp domain-containing protein [Opitutaceae bacterium]|nr:ATP-grasp domain-containing protein [Opitutaceae bacterium]
MADKSEVVPPASSPEYIDHLIALCQREGIGTILPIYSKEIVLIARHVARFAAAGVATLLPPPATISLANDKRGMSGFVHNLGIPVPEIYTGDRWPGYGLIGKPNSSSGSSGVCHIEDERDWDYWRGKTSDYVFQRLARGIEYTVDVLCDRSSQCVVCSPRSRLQVKAGQSIRGRTESRPLLETAARRICSAAGLIGPGNLQFFEDETGINFIELNPRFAAGGLMLTVHAGANIPLLAVQLAQGEVVKTVGAVPGIGMIRYWEELFISDRAQS